MESVNRTQVPLDGNDETLDLENLFEHPAGLQTARNIVRGIFRLASPPQPRANTEIDNGVDENEAGEDADEDEGTSFEVAEILKNILAFSDSVDRVSGVAILKEDAMEIDDEEGQRPIFPPTSFSKSTEHNTTIETSRNLHKSALPTNPSQQDSPRPRALEKSPEREFKSIFGPRASNNTLGTESPLRVESPATRVHSVNYTTLIARPFDDIYIPGSNRGITSDRMASGSGLKSSNLQDDISRAYQSSSESPTLHFAQIGTAASAARSSSSILSELNSRRNSQMAPSIVRTSSPPSLGSPSRFFPQAMSQLSAMRTTLHEPSLPIQPSAPISAQSHTFGQHTPPATNEVGQAKRKRSDENLEPSKKLKSNSQHSELSSSVPSAPTSAQPVTISNQSAPIAAHQPIKSFLPVNKSSDCLSDHNTTTTNDNSKELSESIEASKTIAREQNIETRPYSINQLQRRNLQLAHLRSPSPIPQSSFERSQIVFDLNSNDNTDTESEFTNFNMNNKRKAIGDGAPELKRQKGQKGALIKRDPKQKAIKPPKKVSAKERISDDIWMRIFELGNVRFLGKARLICKHFKKIVDSFDSIYVNCRKENFGFDLPSPTRNLTERQYSDLFGGKGCLEPGCTDEKTSRTHWSWSIRWCLNCWAAKHEREDRLLKQYQNDFPRTEFVKMLECIPAGMKDSFGKPHDYEVDPNRESNAPRLYKYYLTTEVTKIIQEYNDLSPAPLEVDPNASAAETAAARAAHQALMDGLDAKRAAFFAERKAKNDAHMKKVMKIEAAIRNRRSINKSPHDEIRAQRREFFLKMANTELAHIPSSFVEKTKAYKAATRIFRDKGTLRGWKTLKPKIKKEWDDRTPTPTPTPTPEPEVSRGVSDSDEVMSGTEVGRSSDLPRGFTSGVSSASMNAHNSVSNMQQAAAGHFQRSTTNHVLEYISLPPTSYIANPHLPYGNGYSAHMSGNNGLSYNSGQRVGLPRPTLSHFGQQLPNPNQTFTNGPPLNGMRGFQIAGGLHSQAAHFQSYNMPTTSGYTNNVHHPQTSQTNSRLSIQSLVNPQTSTQQYHPHNQSYY